jgi:hypothetical protein
MPVRSEHSNETELEENIFVETLNEPNRTKLIIDQIEQRLYNIEKCYFNPNTLAIVGYNRLRHTPDQYWKSRVYTMFSDAFLPHAWILDIWKHSSHDEDDTYEIPTTVYINIITFSAKVFVKKTLTHFLSQNPDINVYG